jgi:hypothetical protein
VRPWHTDNVPPIPAGEALTVNVFTDLQPELSVYVKFTLPVVTPVATPVDETIVAIVGLPDAHVPPDVAFVSVEAVPVHRNEAPPLAVIALTVTGNVL